MYSLVLPKMCECAATVVIVQIFQFIGEGCLVVTDCCISACFLNVVG